MRIGIVGPGAMGLSFAAFLTRAGSPAKLLARSEERAKELRAGIELAGFGEADGSISFDASADPASLADREAIIFFTKAYDTANAAAALAASGSVPPGCALATLQNGLGNVEAISAAFPGHPLAFGSTSMGAYLDGPRKLVLGGRGAVVLGGRDEASVRAARALAEAFVAAGLGAALTSDPDRAAWEKAVINAAINPIASIAGVPNGGILERPGLALLQRKAAMEAAAAARAAGIDLDGEAMAERARNVSRRTARNRCSMLQDLASGRKTEIEAITGRIVAGGREAGMELPVNEALLALVRAMEG